MKRTLLGVVLVVVLAVAVFILRQGPEESQWNDGVAPQSGQYLNDSLGVGMLLPDAPGWSFKYAPEVPGGGLVMAIQEEQRTSVRLYVHSRQDGVNLEQVVEERRAQLAGLFQAPRLDDVIERVVVENRSEFAGYPAWQWQGLTEPVDVAGQEPQKVMFWHMAMERDDSVIEAVGVMPFAARAPEEQRQKVQQLSEQVAFILQSFQVR